MAWHRVQRMGCDNFCKLLQRRMYTLISSKHGFLLCFGTLLLVFISALQFGEAAFEWSVIRYKNILFPYADNILHKSFQGRLCLPMPIDIVYTWVNGTDPLLLNQLNRLKTELEHRFNDSVPSAENTMDKMKSTHGNGGVKDNPEICPYKDCIALNTLVLQVHSLIKVSELKKVDEIFEKALNIYNISLKSNRKADSKQTRLIVVKFSNKETLNRAVDRSFKIKSENVVSQQAYFTSQATELGVRMRAMAMVIAINRPSDNGILLKQFLHEHFSNKLITLEFYEKENVGVLTFRDDQSYEEALKIKRGDLRFQGYALVFEPVIMVWEPFSFADAKQEDNHFSASRFADNQELRYSLRSVEKFAPWVRQIFIVTNGQIPSWLNLNNPRIKIVTHREIFSNQSHLPTFSSPAIESHLHKIPGLSKKFIYLNDDVMFGAEVWPDDFYTHSKGQKIFLSWPVPNCNEGCPATWINDKYCDKACNVSECDWDGGDCLKANAQPPSTQWRNVWANVKRARPREFCSPGCADSWIGDRYCDGACNNPSCGFDGGDCGTSQFSALHGITLREDDDEFHLPNGLRAMYFNLSEVYGEGKIIEGEQDGSYIVRSITIAQKFMSMIVTFHLNESLTSVGIRLAGYKTMNSSAVTELKFNFTVNTMFDEELEMMENVKHVDTVKTEDVPLKSAWKIPTRIYPIRIHTNDSDHFNYWNDPHTRFSPPTWPTLNSLEYFVPDIPDGCKLPANVMKDLEDLEEELKIGDITKKGYNRRKARLIKENLRLSCDQTAPTTVQSQMKMRSYMKAMTKPLSEESKERTTPTLLDTTKFSSQRRLLNQFDETRIENKGFLPWEKQQTFKQLQDRQMVQERYRTTIFHGRSLLDAFSSSLLHVNRIYNRAFGYKARKVPSHMPHMIDVNIMTELQAFFPKEFDKTSSHKLRSPRDMQFALSYFYYVIDQTQGFNVSRMFREVDVDQSGNCGTVLEMTSILRLKPNFIRSANMVTKFLGLRKGF
ncbi:N-acetylglucosamine-1-phosphotransferase subunits alpha/beta-like isoform X2 [Xenia sp. Carnegie-2017]|uniref:N-acetylglucosamine-1-phosphotransferase subunits alpha/beta-like isoform X2 n=1 Tax=Xenia sp. Carnegie-2017 TaxID=2897299 RepID=UPI001F04A073|nr:N-acetylglucosamine-1-phosphotransferase subunits alpha/beta-like isoform X2 [Xenia sp. Carnegie-2017]